MFTVIHWTITFTFSIRHVRKVGTQIFALKHRGNQWLRGENTLFPHKYSIYIFQDKSNHLERSHYCKNKLCLVRKTSQIREWLFTILKLYSLKEKLNNEILQSWWMPSYTFIKSSSFNISSIFYYWWKDQRISWKLVAW